MSWRVWAGLTVCGIAFYEYLVFIPMPERGYIAALFFFIPGVVLFSFKSSRDKFFYDLKLKKRPEWIQKPPEGFYLFGGLATGWLRSKSHAAGAWPGQKMFLSLPDACQNVCVFGGVGSGKTTRIIQPYLQQILGQNAGALVFNVKGDFSRAVYQLAAETGKEVVTIGVKQTPLNLLKGLTPEMSASFLKSAFYLSGGGRGESAFWIDSAVELCKSGLGFLSYCPGQYSLADLYLFLWDEAARREYVATAEKAASLSDRDFRLLSVYRSYYEQVFSSFDERVRQGVLATVAQVLAPFQHPDLTDYFCSDRPDAANLEDVLQGRVFLVDLPLAIWGVGAKVVYTLIKLRFFNVMQQRQNRPELNQSTPVAFICDEFQEVISSSKVGISDLNFWSVSRSSGCIGIISSQSVSSFRAAVGDRTLADAVLQNFRQKYLFRSEDEETLRYFNSVAGRTEVWRLGSHSGTSHSSHGIQIIGTNGTNQGQSWNLQERPVIDAQLVRQLGTNQAVAMLNIGGVAMDDVVNLTPVFVS